MTNVDELILDELQHAARPVTIREIALNLGHRLGSPVDKNIIDWSLRTHLQNLALVDSCKRWRLISRGDLEATVSRRGQADYDEAAAVPGDSDSNNGDLADLPPLPEDEREKLRTLFRYVLISGGHDPAQTTHAFQRFAEIGPFLTDLLQWAAELEDEKQRLQAAIDLHHGQAEVWTLQSLDGQEVRARVANGKHGAEWELLDDVGKPTGEHLPYRPRDAEELRRHGYTESCAKRPATAMILFTGGGESWPSVVAVPQSAPASHNPSARQSHKNDGFTRLLKRMEEDS